MNEVREKAQAISEVAHYALDVDKDSTREELRADLETIAGLADQILQLLVLN